MHDDTLEDCSGGNRRAVVRPSRAAALISWLHRELVLRWNLERSHAAIATGYGLYLYFAQTFDSAPNTFGTFDRLAQHVVSADAAEALWGGMMVAIGVFTWAGIITGDVTLRRWVGFTRAVLWLLMGGCFFASNPRSPACLLYGILAWASFTRGLNAHRVTASHPE